MEMSSKSPSEFVRLLIMRGLGLYGSQKMMRICEESGLTCTLDGKFHLKNPTEINGCIEKLIVNYSKFNLPAKMTVLVLARKYNIPIPKELQESKNKKSKYRQKIS